MRRKVYRQGDELAGLVFPWTEETAQGVFTNVDISSGWVGAVTLTNTATEEDQPWPSGADPFVTGGNGFWSLTWDVDSLEIPTGEYRLTGTFHHTASNKHRTWNPGLDDPFIIVIAR